MTGFTFGVVVAVKRVSQFSCEVLRSALMMRCRVRRNRDHVRPGQEQPEQGQASGNRAEPTHPFMVCRARRRAQVRAWSALRVKRWLEGPITPYGEQGRKIYSFRNLTVDAVLPLSLLPFLFLFMREGLKVMDLGRLPAALLLSVPIAYVVFDFAENAVVVGLLARFPDRVHFLAAVLPYLTVVKRTASIMALLIPFVVLTFAFVRRRLRRAA